STTACLKRSSNTRLPLRRIPITGSTLLDDSTCIASTPQHGGHNRRGLAYSTQGCQYRTLTKDMYPNQRVIDWEGDPVNLLSIEDPYFLFYLRWSDKLASLRRDSAA